MSFWNYIGEFFLFRWLFSKFRKSTTEHGTHTESIGTSIGRDSEYVNRDHNTMREYPQMVQLHLSETN